MEKEYKLRVINYNKIHTPEDLLKFMDSYIEYGIYGTDNKAYINWENDINSSFQVACQTKYELCDKKRILKYGLGICYDQTELERFWFKEHNYKYKTFFIWFCFNENNNYPTHTYLVYEENNEFCYFEHADFNNKGILKFDSYKSAIMYQMERYVDFIKKCNLEINDEILNRIWVIEYNVIKYGLNMEEYYNNLFKSKIVYENGRFTTNL